MGRGSYEEPRRVASLRGLLAARLKNRLARRVALGPSVVLPLAAVAGSEVRIRDCRRRRNGKRTHRQHQGEELPSPHGPPTLPLGSVPVSNRAGHPCPPRNRVPQFSARALARTMDSWIQLRFRREGQSFAPPALRPSKIRPKGSSVLSFVPTRRGLGAGPLAALCATIAWSIGSHAQVWATAIGRALQAWMLASSRSVRSP